MEHGGEARLDPWVVAASVVGVAAVVWLAPLMFDQLVFFGDREQARRAAESRVLMVPAAMVLLVVAGVALMRATPRLAVLASLPAVVTVPLAFLAPDAAFQLLSFAFTAPLAIGALVVAATRSRPGR